MFLIRLAFWLTLVLLVLPMPRSETGEASGTTISAFDALGFAQSAVSDVAGFCDRNPRACETGAMLIGTLREKAIYGSQLVYRSLSAEPDTDPSLAGPDAPEGPDPQAGPDSGVAAPLRPSLDTLSEEDRQVSWRGPLNG
ncbi:DUF5330 domain-containing protein [Lutibaculum baratangense]|uniref:DUF5330 domain-containing protein n=1 Tax=Lutibaculum baratangense AMV1 TaxID=631454 RepID=V4RHL7_9HYPH|nr:DUF5330 domain-containing protein [Lutibaculum baratangense]ESR22765.1 hypothetical protein N177_3902 [Lutibaculum baratangense AMV1]